MRKTIKSKLILSEIILLLCTIGMGSVFYMLFAEEYYISQKKKIMEQAFEALKQEDLEQIRYQARLDEESEKDEEEIETFFHAYESENLVFIITDGAFQKVYLTHQAERQQKNTRKIYNNIEKLEDNFSEDAKASYVEQENGKGKISFLGILWQKNEKYYVSIHEYTYMAEKSFFYANQFLLLALMIAIILGSILFYFLTERITKPIQMIDQVTGRIAKKDFSVRVHGPFDYIELERLGDNINAMSEQIQAYIAELEKYNGELVAENQHKTELEQMRKFFVNNVSHELKTPLAIISSQTEMLLYLKDEEDRKAYCESIMDEAAQMSNMVSSMLAIFSIEQGMEEMEMEPFDLGELAFGYGKGLKPLFERKRIQFYMEIGKDCMIQGNIKYMQSVINNYCMNAYRHTGEYKKIVLKVFRLEGKVVLSVYNDGKNIEEGEIEKIWNSFYCGGNRDTVNGINGDFKGTGLGLYIVKSIIKLHYGCCGVRNEKEGVTFWCSLDEWSESPVI